MVPYITPPAVVALLFCYMFDGNFGVINDLLVRIGVLDRYVAWLSDPTASFWVVVSAMVWYGQPLMALILLAALQTIPLELYEAAHVDGAGALRTFWYITLPHLMPSILFLVLLRTIWMSNHIDMIFVMTGGGPGFSNYTEAVYSFKLTNQFQIGYASAVAVVLAIILVAASALYVRHLARTVLRASVMRKRNRRLRAIWIAIGAGAILVYSLGAAAVDLHRVDHPGAEGRRDAAVSLQPHRDVFLPCCIAARTRRRARAPTGDRDAVVGRGRVRMLGRQPVVHVDHDEARPCAEPGRRDRALRGPSDHPAAAVDPDEDLPAPVPRGLAAGRDHLTGDAGDLLHDHGRPVGADLPGARPARRTPRGPGSGLSPPAAAGPRQRGDRGAAGSRRRAAWRRTLRVRQMFVIRTGAGRGGLRG